MSYSLQDLCNHIGLNGELRNLRYIYENADGPPSLDPEHYPLPPLNRWTQIRPYSPSVGIYKGITPYILIDKNELVLLGANLVNRIEWECDFTTDIDSPGLLKFYDSFIDKSYNHIAAPPSDLFEVFPCNASGVLVLTVYNGSTDNAGEGGYDHWINLLKIYLDKGNDERIGIPAVLDTSNTFSKFNVWMVPSNTSIPARTINNSYFIKDINTEDYNGRRIIYDTDGLGLEEGYYTFYPYIEIDESFYAFPGQLNPLTIYITAVPSVPYVPVAGIHWSPDKNNSGTILQWLKVPLNSPSAHAIAVVEGEGGDTPTHARIRNVYSTNGLTSIIDYEGSDGSWPIVMSDVNFSTGDRGGIDIIRAVTSDSKSPAFTADLKVYVGNIYVHVEPLTANLRIRNTDGSLADTLTVVPTISIGGVSQDVSLPELFSWSTATLSDRLNGDAIVTRDSSGNGIVIGTSPGYIDVRATIADEFDECVVYVYNPIANLTITQPTLTIEEGDTTSLSDALNAVVTGYNSGYGVTRNTIYWWSPNENVATVVPAQGDDTKGIVHGVSYTNSGGKVTLLASVEDPYTGEIYYDYCEVTVVEPSAPYVPLTGVRWIPDSINTGVEITWIDLSNSATLYTYMTGEGGQIPTRAHIYISSLDSAIVSVESYTDNVTASANVMSHTSGVAFLSATASDPNNTFTKYLTVYVGGRDLIYTTPPRGSDNLFKLNLKTTTSTTVVALATPRSTYNNYYWYVSSDTSTSNPGTITKGNVSTASDHSTSSCVITGDRPGHALVTVSAVEMNTVCHVFVYNPVTGVNITEYGTQSTPFELEEGDTIQLHANLQALNSSYPPTDSDTNWFCHDSNPNPGASVNASGLVTGLIARTNPVKITASSDDTSQWNDYTAYSDEVWIKVIPRSQATILITSITLCNHNDTNIVYSNGLTIYLDKNTQLEIRAIPYPNDYTENYSWSISNPSLAHESSNNHNVVIVGPSSSVGSEVSITAQASNTYTRVTVKIYDSTYVAVSRVDITESSLIVYTNHGSSSLIAYVYSSGSATPTNKTVKWSSSNTSVLNFGNNSNTALTESGNSVSLNPKTTSNSAITITAKSAEDESITDTCLVYVREWNYVDSITLNPTSATIYTGNSSSYSHEVSISASTGSASESGVTWSLGSGSSNYIELVSSSESRAVYKAKSITPSGTTAQIIATSIGLDSNGQHKTATCNVTVLAEPADIQFTTGIFTVTSGGTIILTYNTIPSDASVSNVTFSIWEDPNHAIYSLGEHSGTVVASSSNTGIAVIKLSAQVNNTNCETACLVEVEPGSSVPSVTSVTLNSHSESLYKGSTVTLGVTVSPPGANQNVTWSSSNTSVATVSSSGVVTAKSKGTATITVKSDADNTKSDTCTITVIPLVTGIEIYNIVNSLPISNHATLRIGSSYRFYSIVSPSDANLTTSWSISPTGYGTIELAADYKGNTSYRIKPTALNSNITLKVSATDTSGVKTTATLKFLPSSS